MKAERCPVCYGTGKYTPQQNPFSTAVAQPVTCHGCFGKGWVEVTEDRYKGYFPGEFTKGAGTSIVV